MSLKDRFKKVGILFQVEERLEGKKIELEEKKFEVREIEETLSKKRAELESLRNEVIELRDFINSNFMKEFDEYDYKVDIANCYVIGLNGKMYIVSVSHDDNIRNIFSIITGYLHIETYKYYDVLNPENSKKQQYKCIHEFEVSHDDYGALETIIYGKLPDYQTHILELYPELVVFPDGKVPNTYLKKIYYEVNDLGNKQMIKK